jgi:hypothetical protein
MNLKSVKKQDEVKLAGIVVEVEFKDSMPTGVVLRDVAGGALVVRAGQYSGLDVMVPAPPKMVERFRIAGAVKGIKFVELFESEYAASSRLVDLEVSGVQIEKVSVPEEDGPPPPVLAL